MRKPRSALVLLALVACTFSAAASANDWYVHRTSHEIDEPPWYCYCYRLAKDSILAGTDSYPMDMQISWELAQSRVAGYLALSDTCSANCGIPAAGVTGGQSANSLIGRWQIVRATGPDGTSVEPSAWFLQFDGNGTFSVNMDGSTSGGGWRQDGPSRAVMDSTTTGEPFGAVLEFSEGGHALVIRYDNGSVFVLERAS